METNKGGVLFCLFVTYQRSTVDHSIPKISPKIQDIFTLLKNTADYIAMTCVSINYYIEEKKKKPWELSISIIPY